MSALFSNITRAFKYKNYRDYFFWQFLSFLGTWLQSTAQSWLVYRLTQSAFFLGFLGFSSTLPALLLTPISGIVSDHFKRKNVLLTTQILCLIQGLILIFFYYNHSISKWHILYLAIFLGIVNSFDITARQSLIPLFIGKEDLINAIALNSSMFNAARMLGPAIAGLLIAHYNEGICFILNVLSYIPMVLFLFLVKINEQEIKKFSSPFNHLKEGFNFAWKNLCIRYLLLLLGVMSFWGIAFGSLMPVFSDQILHSGSRGLGFLMGASGLGAVLGGIFLASRHNTTGLKDIIACSGVVFSIVLFCFSISKIFLLSLFLLLILGFTFMIISSGSNTVIQSIAPDYIRGRIIGLYSFMFMGMFPLGSLTLGLLARTYSAETSVKIGAIACFIMSIVFLFLLPKIKKC